MREHAGMLLWAFLVGLSFPVVGWLDALPPLLLTALRFAVACAGLWWLARRSADFWPAWRTLPLYGVMGLCLAGFFSAMFWAAHHATAISMATLYVTVPLQAYAMGLVLGVERRAWRMLAVLLLGACGALLLALAEAVVEGGALQFGKGEAVFFFGCTASALYPVVSKWGLSNGRLSSSAAVRTFWSLALGGVLVGALGLAVEPASELAALSMRDALLLVYLGLGSSALTFWLMQHATAALTPGAVTAYGYLVPFVSMLLLFAQSPGTISWVWLPGSVLVVLTIALLASGRAAR